MALTQSSSSSTSGDSLSDCRPPLVSSVQLASPALIGSPQQSPAKTSSPKQQQHLPLPEDKVISSTSSSSPPASTSTSSSVVATATSSPGLLSPPPPPLLSAMPAIRQQQQQTPFSIQTLLPGSAPQSLSLGASPSSSMLGRIQFPMQLSAASVPLSSQKQQPAASPSTFLPQLPQPMLSQHPGVLISGPMNQMELDMLKNLQQKIRERLWPPMSHEEGLADQGRPSAPTKLMEWKASMDSAPSVVEFTHCVAGPQERLEEVPFYQERMRQLLAQHEVKIQYIDRQPQPPPLILPTSAMASAVALAASVATPTVAAHTSGPSNPTPLTQQVSLSRDTLLPSRPLASSSSISLSSTSSSVPTVPSIGSAPSTCIAATPTTSTVASCPFTLPTTGMPATPNPPILTLPSPYGGLISPLILGQTPVSAAAGTVASAQVQSPLVPVVLPQQAVGGTNVCILQPPLHQTPQLPVAGVISPPAALSGAPSAVPAPTAAALTGLPQTIQPTPTIIPGLQTGGILLNNMAVAAAGGVNTPMYVVMPAYPTVLPAAPLQTVPQSVPASNPSSGPVLQVARSASVMLDNQRTLQQHLSQPAVQRQDAVISTTERLRNIADIPRLGKRTKHSTLPDSMGEKILRLENPAAAAATSSGSPSKLSSVTADQNHPIWVPGKPNVPSGTCQAEVGRVTPHGRRTISSSDSDKSSKTSDD